MKIQMKNLVFACFIVSGVSVLFDLFVFFLNFLVVRFRFKSNRVPNPVANRFMYKILSFVCVFRFVSIGFHFFSI